MTRKESGLTAFELTVTLAIMAVIASLTMPPYLNWLRTSRLQSAATNLTTDLELAKVLAIRENSMVVVEFEANSYTVFVDNGQGGGTRADWNRNGTENIAQIRDLPAGVQIDTDNLSFPVISPMAARITFRLSIWKMPTANVSPMANAVRISTVYPFLPDGQACSACA